MKEPWIKKLKNQLWVSAYYFELWIIEQLTQLLQALSFKERLKTPVLHTCQRWLWESDGLTDENVQKPEKYLRFQHFSLLCDNDVVLSRSAVFNQLFGIRGL